MPKRGRPLSQTKNAIRLRRKKHIDTAKLAEQATLLEAVYCYHDDNCRCGQKPDEYIALTLDGTYVKRRPNLLKYAIPYTKDARMICIGWCSHSDAPTNPSIWCRKCGGNTTYETKLNNTKLFHVKKLL